MTFLQPLDPDNPGEPVLSQRRDILEQSMDVSIVTYDKHTVIKTSS